MDWSKPRGTQAEASNVETERSNSKRQPPVGLSSLLIRVVTHNIRYAATGDSLQEGEQVWEGTRGPRVTSQLRFTTLNTPAAFICMQEVLKRQLDDILSGLNHKSTAAKPSSPEWTFIGVGREDGKEEGEYSPILYRPSIWTLSNWTTIWLSETPDVPSKGWDAGSTRILTIGDFLHKESGQAVLVMNTHFDNVGTVSRENSARIVTERINARQTNANRTKPVILTGDFNSTPNQEAYQYLTQESSPVKDVREQVPENERYGNRIGTFTGFDRSDEAHTLIDHILVDKKSAWGVRTYAVLANVFDDGVYCSDHQAVVSDLDLSLDG